MYHLGVYNDGYKCCIISTDLSFDEILDRLKKDPSYKFTLGHSSTNWCGFDATERTLEIKGFKLTGRKVPYEHTFIGVDQDTTSTMDWSFTITAIYEIDQVDYAVHQREKEIAARRAKMTALEANISWLQNKLLETEYELAELQKIDATI